MVGVSYLRYKAGNVREQLPADSKATLFPLLLQVSRDAGANILVIITGYLLQYILTQYRTSKDSGVAEQSWRISQLAEATQ